MGTSETLLFSYGQTPISAIEDRLPEVYDVSLVGPDKDVFLHVIKVGIDSSLEAINFEHQTLDNYKLQLQLSRESVLTLLRRLLDTSLTTIDAKTVDACIDLRQAILSTLNICEV